VEAQAAKMGTAAVVRAMELIGQALIDMHDSADPRTTLEVALVRLSAPDLDDTPAALLERIERLERSGGPEGAGPPAGAAEPAVGRAEPAAGSACRPDCPARRLNTAGCAGDPNSSPQPRG